MSYDLGITDYTFTQRISIGEYTLHKLTKPIQKIVLYLSDSTSLIFNCIMNFESKLSSLQ